MLADEAPQMDAEKFCEHLRGFIREHLRETSWQRTNGYYARITRQKMRG
jgi:hypothetical protein